MQSAVFGWFRCKAVVCVVWRSVSLGFLLEYSMWWAVVWAWYSEA